MFLFRNDLFNIIVLTTYVKIFIYKTYVNQTNGVDGKNMIIVFLIIRRPYKNFSWLRNPIKLLQRNKESDIHLSLILFSFNLHDSLLCAKVKYPDVEDYCDKK